MIIHFYRKRELIMEFVTIHKFDEEAHLKFFQACVVWTGRSYIFCSVWLEKSLYGSVWVARGNANHHQKLYEVN